MGVIGFWQLVDMGGAEPGTEARASAQGEVSDVLGAAGLRPGPLTPAQVLNLGGQLSTRLIECLKGQLAPYDPDLLIPALVGQNELLSAATSWIEDDLTRPVEEMSLPFPAGLLTGVISATASVSLRFLVELAAAQPPRGIGSPDASGIQDLWGLAEALLEVGTVRDAATSTVEQVHLERHGALLYLRPGQKFDTAMRAQSEALSSMRMERLRGLTNDMPQPRVFTLVDETLNDLLGLDAMGFIEVMRRAQEISLQHGGSVCIAPRGSVVAAIARQDMDPHAVQCTVDWLSLAPVSSFSPSATRYPWRFRRSHSYIRRPFVKCQTSGREPVLIWGGNHVDRSMRFLVEALTTGALPAEGSRLLEVHNGTLGHWRGEVFEDELARLFLRRVPEMQIESRVEGLGADELGPGAEPLSGDVDLLIADSVRRCITLVEAKANLPAFAIYNVVGEARRFAVAGDESERSDLEKHLQRITWAERHLEGLVGRSGFGSSEGWQVQGRWVTKEPAASALLGEQIPVAITSMRELREGDVRAWLAPACPARGQRPMRRSGCRSDPKYSRPTEAPRAQVR
jgi:hypothetical protein